MLLFIKRIITGLLSFLMVFVSNTTGLFSEQIETLRSVNKITDNFYTMDYTFDYNLKDVLTMDMSTNVGVYIYGLKNTFNFPSPKLPFLKKCGCTTFNCVDSEGDYIFARNFDYMESPFLLVHTKPESGYESLSFVSLYLLGFFSNKFQPEDEASSLLTLLAPYAPLDGINEKGLAIGVLELEKEPVFQISEKPNLTTTTIIRAVLDKAATVEQALDIFRSHDVRDMLLAGCTYHYQIADAQGNTAVVEYVKNKLNILYPEKKENAAVDYMTAANYFLTEGVYDPNGMGQDRVEIVNSVLNETGAVLSQEEAMKTLQSVSMKNADLHGYACSTLWSSVYDLNEKTINVCVNNDYGNVYSFNFDSFK